jgi:acyl-CoA synthetase (AMP-forming)/AMP-acid ligase II
LSFGRDGMRQNGLTYAMLELRAQAVAVALQERCAPGDRAMLVFPSGLGFVEAFFGCLYAGVLAVPVSPPRVRALDHVGAIARDCTARVLLCLDSTDAPAALGTEALPCIVTTALPDSLASLYAPPEISDDAIAFLQYTSGSTGAPKGAIVSHRALLANLAQIQEAFLHDATCVGVNWLPLHHDMGLIGTVLEPVYVGFPSHLMSPLNCVQRPLNWLAAIDALGGTTCGGPPFVYRHCVERIPEAARASLDLRTWRVAFCGAEAIPAECLRSFANAFAPAGFRARSFLPCYGLAEATLFVTGARHGQGATLATFDADLLDRGLATPFVPTSPNAPEGAGAARTLVGCGVAAKGTEVTITDAKGLPLSEGQIGEIRVRGANVSSGYWGREAASSDTFALPVVDSTLPCWLRTGDLGFLYCGELFVTGRSKDLIVIDGRNIAAQDLEWTVLASHERVSGVAALPLRHNDGERVLLLVEISGRPDALEVEQIGDTARKLLATQHGVSLSGLVLVRAPGLLRTTSGKIARTHCAAAWRDRTLEVIRQWDPTRRWHADVATGLSGQLAAQPIAIVQTAPTPNV